METTIIQSIYAGISGSVDNKTKLLGYYPYDFDKVYMNNPAILAKMGDTTIQAMGKHRYEYTYNTQFILFYENLSFSNIETLQNILISNVYDVLNANTCTRDYNVWNIQTGDINQYATPSSTGYQANMVVRKLTISYITTKTIT